MLLKKERSEVVKYCRRLISSGLTKGTGGNISILNRELDLVAISPSGMDYFEMKASDVTVVTVTGEIAEGKRKPSSELLMHLAVYNGRDDAGAVVHTHSPYCTVLATLRKPLPASSYLVALAGKDVRCAPYCRYGTPELAAAALEAMADRNAVLLANHGLLAAGATAAHAFMIAEELEFCAQVYAAACAVGSPALLDDAEMAALAEKFKGYGQ